MVWPNGGAAKKVLEAVLDIGLPDLIGHQGQGSLGLIELHPLAHEDVALLVGRLAW